MSPMNNRLLVPRKVPGLLDLVPGAAAAYSLRSLSRSYADPVVTVRRSSDDDEGSFTAAEVSDGTLAAWCGAGDGFVKQWWDQSGNENHAVAAADPNEPQIVDSGVVVTEEGKPALQFDGTDSYFLMTSAASLVTAFIVAANKATTNAVQYVVAGVTSGIFLNGTVAIYNNIGVYDGALIAKKAGAGDNSQHLIALISQPSGTSLYVDGALEATGATSTLTAGAIGTRPDSLALKANGTIQEVIIYPSDLTAQRELVEGLIAWGYSV
jgi:hypothetical protein